MKQRKCYTPKCRRKPFMSLGGREWFCKEHFVILQTAEELKTRSKWLFQFLGLDEYGQPKEGR